MQVFFSIVFGNGRDVGVKLNVVPPLIKRGDGPLGYTWDTRIKRTDESILSPIGKETVKHAIAVLHFLIISHARCVAHPDTLALDDA